MMYPRRFAKTLFAKLVFAIAIAVAIAIDILIHDDITITFTTIDAFTIGTISIIQKLYHHHKQQQFQRKEENLFLNRHLLTKKELQSRCFVLQYKEESRHHRHNQNENDPNGDEDMYHQRLSNKEIIESIRSSTTTSTSTSTNNENDTSKNTRNVIPVIGPFIQRLSCPPLIPGQEYIIKSPTPMQWNTLQESLLIHQNQNQNNQQIQKQTQQHDTSDKMISSSSNLAASAAAAINQAPIIALLENHNTNNNEKCNQQQQYNRDGTSSSSSGRYATICAIVGMRTPSTTSKSTDMGTIDSSSFSNLVFVNSKTKTNKNSLLDSTQIRLVAIGRAIIDKFYYQLPTSTIEQTTDIILDDKFNAQYNSDMNNINDDDDNYEIDDVSVNDDVLLQKLNIIMSEFSIVSDNNLYSSTTPTRNIGYTSAGSTSHKFSSGSIGRSATSSPMHALAEMSKLAFEIQTMHIQRQQLVKGIKAGRTRLAQRDTYSNSNNRNGRNSYVHTEHKDTELLDYDGIGELFGFTETIVNDIKAIKEHVQQQQHINDDESTKTKTTTRRRISNGGSSYIPTQLETQYDNYGLGTGPASISTIHDMVRVKIEQLQSYYSIEYQSTEEYYYEIVSNVVLESLIGWIQPNDIIWSLCTCYNTKDRLQYLLVLMQSHCSQLKYEAYYISEALLQYNEKCTDLW